MSCPPIFNGLVPSDRAYSAVTITPSPTVLENVVACNAVFNNVDTLNLSVNGSPVSSPVYGFGNFIASDHTNYTFNNPNDSVNIVNFNPTFITPPRNFLQWHRICIWDWRCMAN